MPGVSIIEKVGDLPAFLSFVPHDKIEVNATHSRRTKPSQSVILDIGDHAGALVLSATDEREFWEVEIHPSHDPTHRTHVEVLAREGVNGIVYAAIFPSLTPGEYSVLSPESTIAFTVNVMANGVTRAEWR